MNKNFRVGERWRWLLSSNWEGAFNHPLFGNPNMTPTSSLFGTVTGTTGEARRVYVGLKLYF